MLTNSSGLCWRRSDILAKDGALPLWLPLREQNGQDAGQEDPVEGPGSSDRSDRRA